MSFLSKYVALNFSLDPPHIATKSLNSEQTLSQIMALFPDKVLPSSTCIGF